MDRQVADRRPLGADRSLWLWNGILALVVGVQVLSGIWVDRGGQGIQDVLHSDDSERAVRALFVATNRDQPPKLRNAEISRLLTADNALVREWLFTTNFERIMGTPKQRKMLTRLEPSKSTDRARFFFEHGIRKTPWLTWQEFDAYLSDLRYD